MPKLIVKKDKISIIAYTIVVHQYFYIRLRDFYIKKGEIFYIHQ